MKRVGNLYHKIYDIENIKLAHKNARKGKTHYVEVIEVDNNIDYYCNLLQESLKNKTFQNSPYEVFIKQEQYINYLTSLIEYCTMQYCKYLNQYGKRLL